MAVEPQTPEEWQNAVDAAHGALLTDSAHKYGLVSGGPTVIVSRCEEILARGKELGVEPSSDSAERYVRELLADGA